MKKLIAIAIALIAILAMVIPAYADTVSGGVVVGANTTPPYMIALTVTPDETAGDGVQVDPEFCKPNLDGSFPPTNIFTDGWKMVKFYVEIGHPDGVSNIDNVAIDVNYPASFADAGDTILFGARADTLKFEINVHRDGSSWLTEVVYPYSEFYPGMVPADPLTPKTPWLARELVYSANSSSPNYDMVDVNCDHNLGNDNDKSWEDFLPYWGTSRVKYASGYDADTAFDRYQLGEAIVLEIKGWFWFHQPGDHYNVSAKAATEGGATSPVLSGGASKFLKYNRVIGLYLDFDAVNYGPVQVGGTSWDEGDRLLTTPDFPTVWNNGNASAEVLVASTKLVKDYDGVNPPDIHDSIYYDQDAKTIIHFDAKLYFCDGAGDVVQVGEIDYLADTDPAVITSSPNPVLLQACRPAKICFSVEPEAGEGQEAGNYKGFVTVSVAAYTGTTPVEP